MGREGKVRGWEEGTEQYHLKVYNGSAESKEETPPVCLL